MIHESLPPQDLEAERCLLGSILIDNRALDIALELVDRRRFYFDAHGRMFDAIRGLIEAGQPADAVTVRADLERRGDLDAVGGVPYILKILETVPHAAHADYYAKIVRRKSDARAAVELFTDGLRELSGGSDDVEDVLGRAERGMLEITAGTHGRTALPVGEFFEDTLAGIAERMGADEMKGGLPSGFAELDDLLQPGLKPSALVVLAGRPGQGKTSLIGCLAEQIAGRAARTAKPEHVLIFSLEMGRHELAERLLSIRSRVCSSKISRGDIDEIDQAAMMEAAAEIQQLPIIIDDTPAQTVSRISAIARQEHRRRGLSVVIIDYLQLIEPEDKRIPREQQVAAITRRLKFLAKELRVPVIALAQLNRGLENREDKRPRLADLRESGSIEQDADVVLLLHRPDAYDPSARPNEADLIVAKNRGGPLGVAPLVWMPNLMRFADRAPVQDPGHF